MPNDGPLSDRYVLDAAGETISPTHNREAWKLIREPLIGSSDSAAILGKDEYRGPWSVWDRIVLGLWGADRESADIRRGNRQERSARERFTEVMGLEIGELPMVRDALDEWLVTDVDGYVLQPKQWPVQVRESALWSGLTQFNGPGWVELKCPRVARYYQYKEEGLPEPYLIQGQHHGLVTGFSWGLFAFYTPEYDDVIAFPVATDPAFGTWLRKALGGWRKEHVLTEKRPERPVFPPPEFAFRVPGEAMMMDEDTDWMLQADLVVQWFHELKETQENYDKAVKDLVKLVPEGKHQHLSGGGVNYKRWSTKPRRMYDVGRFQAAVALAQQNRDVEALLAIEPLDPAFYHMTESKVKAEVNVFAPNPMEAE